MHPNDCPEQPEGHSEEQGSGRECRLYRHRFSPLEEAARETAWRVLVETFLQGFVSAQDTVIDLGAGDGLFIKNIRARRRVAVDVGEHVHALGGQGIEVVQAPATALSVAFSGRADVVFMSNFLEHLPHKGLVLDVLDECRRVLRPEGTLLVLQPNIRYVREAYWDYIDHHIALTEHSLLEALEICDFTVTRMIPRFLPYTAKSRGGRLAGGRLGELAVRAYLRFPLAWRLFGAQTFVVARPGMGGAVGRNPSER